MRGHQLPIGVIAFASGFSTVFNCGHDIYRANDRGRCPFPLNWTIPWLPSVTCRADASAYDSMEPTPAEAISATGELRWPVSEGRDPDDNTDTVTGVFHRLNPQHAKLLLVQVVFRHGARTTLSNRSELWRGQQWDVCGEAYQAAAMRLFSTAGVENPVSKHDLRQRAVVLEGGCRKGELTLLGQSQALDMGRWLRSNYVETAGFLPPTYQDGVVKARTTNISRTIATLRGVLTGLYPDLPKQQHAEHQQQLQQRQQEGYAPQPGSQLPLQQQLQLQPQPQDRRQPSLHSPGVPHVTTSADLDEILYADTRACPHLGSFQAVSRELARAAVRSDPEYEWARGELLGLLGMDPASFDSNRWIFTDIHDVMTSLAAHGKTLPPGFEGHKRLLEAIDRLATKEFSAEVAPSMRDSHGLTILRLSMGRLLHILVENMQRSVVAGAAAAGGVVETASAGTGLSAAAATDAARSFFVAAGSADGKSRPKMYLYSGHDSTIMPLLSAMGLDITKWPPYMSNLVFELWQLPSRRPGAEPRYVVRVLFNREELSLPHCPPGFLPSFQTFQREVVGPFQLSAQRHQELCRVKVDHDGAMPQPKAKAASGTA
ncbi:hypothetical protein Vafri_17410 [Volvox africanus]|uniref:Acid phosphatase n=1 Tax=Volvox africanus TaxID=51714 RepID=A0A8J4BQF3_9CHLO|nr:hypothetical protein Vafri_17410 [Volvox africanus]